CCCRVFRASNWAVFPQPRKSAGETICFFTTRWAATLDPPLSPCNWPVAIGICCKLNLEEVRRVLGLLRISQHQAPIRGHLPINILKEVTSVLRRKIQQHIP